MSTTLPASNKRRTLLVLTGFMGTGKTSVGRRVAQRLGYEFVDTDEWIEAREGMAVATIFQTQGEVAFRTLEARLCEKLADRSELVIATGGGMLVRAENRLRFKEACVICLDASVESLLARLDGSDRPLLASGAIGERVTALLKERLPAYAAIEHHIDTTNKTIDQVAGQVFAVYRAHLRSGRRRR